MLESVKRIIGASCPVIAGSKVSPEMRILRAQARGTLVELDNFIGIRAIGVQVHECSQGVVIFRVGRIPPDRRLNCVRCTSSKIRSGYRPSHGQIDKE